MRKRQLIILLVLIILLIQLFILFIDSNKIYVIDSWFYQNVEKIIDPKITYIMLVITQFGSFLVLALMSIGLLLNEKTRRYYSIPIFVSITISTLLNQTLKFLIEKPRPDILRLIEENGYSFPSGHAMVTMTFYTMIILLTLKYIKNIKLKYSIILISISLIILIGLSRIYLGVHYLTDVFAGWTLGFMIALIIYKLFKEKVRIKL